MNYLAEVMIMGKTYIDTVKYVIYAGIDIDGIVEKPDVVGAIFGQTEGLLGDELDLRELQKSGRIGRIEVELKNQPSKCVGQIILPSSLDRIETAVLGAALETVDRVGPCEAKISVNRIEDTRTMKRKHVIDRAKNILRTMITDILPESKEISELVRDEVKTAELSFFGPERLPCGPKIAEADHIIIVEGRADVLTMLKCDIQNVIALQGKNIPKSVVGLTKEKTVTVFVDGDRGGDLVIKQMANIAEVDYVAKAPDGKEVEELTKKEVIKCLRRKIPFDQFISKTFKEDKISKEEPAVKQSKEEKIFAETLEKLVGTLKGALLNQNLEVICETDVKNLSKEIETQKDVYAIIFDGIVTQRLVDLANEKNTKYVIGVKQSKIENKGRVEVLTSE